jgi:riboflavin synthase
MFTGLVEEIGTIVSISKGLKASTLTIGANYVLADVKVGDSISTNGVCLTVTQFSKSQFSVDVMPETMNRSNFASAKTGMKVNLERALRMGDRLGGHMVSGHIDGTGKIVAIDKDENATWYTLSAPASIMKYIIEKGSVALDGISLTVAAVDFESFKVSIIPHTRAMTTLDARKVGDIINIECDAFGKYVERITAFNQVSQGQEHEQEHGNAKTKSKLDMAFLEQNGFL